MGTRVRYEAWVIRRRAAAGALQFDGDVDERERGGGYAGNAAGLADGDGTDALKGFAHLAREAADGAVLDPVGDGDGLGSFEFFNRLLLLLEVAGELDLSFDGAGFVAEGGAGERRPRGGVLDEFCDNAREEGIACEVVAKGSE